MKKIGIALAAMVVIAGCIVVRSALAYYGGPQWTTDQAEVALFNSHWADANEIEDVNCEGISPATRTTPRGVDLYKSFSCAASYSDTDQFDEAETCSFKVTVRPLPSAGTLRVRGDNGVQIVGGNLTPRCEIDPIAGQWTGNG